MRGAAPLEQDDARFRRFSIRRRRDFASGEQLRQTESEQAQRTGTKEITARV